MKYLSKIGYISLIFSIIWLILTPNKVEATGEFWSTPQKISNNSFPDHAISPATVTDSDGYFHSVWMELTDSYPWSGWPYTNGGVKYSFWNGDVWSTPITISQSDFAIETPSLAADSSNNLYAVWQDAGGYDPSAVPPNPNGSWWRIIMRKKTSAGWQTPVSVSAGLDTSTSVAIWPKIAVDSTGKIHVVFSYRPDKFGSEPERTYYTNSTDGTTWTTPVEVSDAAGSEHPSLVVDSGNNLHLVYNTKLGMTYGSIKYRRLPSGGAWSAPVTLSTAGEYPKLTVDGSSNTYVIWDESSSPGKVKVMESRRNNSTGIFSTPFEVSVDAKYSAWGYPVDGVTTDTAGNAYVGWGQLEADGKVTARYLKWTAGSNTWSADSIIRTTEDMDAPFIYKDKWDNQHFVWTERKTLPDETRIWETWYSVVPSAVGQYTPGSQLVLTHPVTNDTLTLTSSSLSQAATISAQVGPLPASFGGGFTTINRSYIYRPHGTTFVTGQNASALIRYLDSEVNGADERNMQVHIWDSTLATPAWSALGGQVNAAQNRITISLPHFSLHGVSVPNVNLAFQSPGVSVEGTTIPVSFDLTYAKDGSAVPPIVEGLENHQPGDNVALYLKDSQGNNARIVYSDPEGGGNDFTVNGANYQVNLSTNGLTEGDYTLEVRIGGTFIGSQQVHVIPIVTLTFAPSADTYVKSDSPNGNFGTNSSLHIKAPKPTFNSYLKFNLSGITGTIQTAKLRLFVTDTSPIGGSIYTVSNNFQGTSNPWTESGLTWKNAPAIEGTALSAVGNALLSSWVEFDVKPAISSDGIYSFGIKSTSTNKVIYSSKEAASNKPELVIVMGGGATPTSTPTPIDTPTPTPTITGPSPTPTVTPTIISSPTPTPTPTPSPTGGPTVTPTPTPGTVELLQNPGFELDDNGDNQPDNWTLDNRFTKSTENVHGGTSNGKHLANNNSDFTIKQSVSSIIPNQNYTLSGWTNIPQTNDTFTYKLQLRWKDAAGNVIRTDTIKTYSTSTSGWDQASATLTAPANSASVLALMTVINLNATIYSDDLSLK